MKRPLEGRTLALLVATIDTAMSRKAKHAWWTPMPLVLTGERGPVLGLGVAGQAF